jgi:hypothetical protein
VDPLTLGLMTTLFPTGDHREVGLGAYGYTAGPLVDPVESFDTLLMPQGVELLYRRVYDTEEMLNDDGSATGNNGHLRLTRDATGAPQLDSFVFESPLINVRARPTLGDQIDVGLLLGRWDEVWRYGDNGRVQWRFFTPMQVTLLGLSNNDMDPDDRLKYYVAAGAGLGGDAVLKVAGPIGLQARVDAGTVSTNRMRAGPNSTRHELDVNAELGLTLLLEKQAWVLGGWVNHVTQWDPRDAEGRDGVDRQYMAGGARLSVRFYEERELPIPEIAEEPDLDALLRSLMEGAEEGEEAKPGLFDRPGGPRREAPPEPPEEVLEGVIGTQGQGDGGVIGGVVAPRDPSVPLELHWSEVAQLSGEPVVWPAGAAADASCKVRFVIDPTGSPTDIRPEDCAADLLPAVMKAAWTYRFSPAMEAGSAVSAQFVYVFTPGT